MRAAPVVEAAAVRYLGRTLGLGEVTPTLIHTGHHRCFRLDGHGLVARVQSAEAIGPARATAAREVAVARHLAARGAPALAPDASLGDPHVVGRCVITLWPFVADARSATEAEASSAAAALAALHAGLRDYPGDLPPHAVELDRCDALLASRVPLALDTVDRRLLRGELDRLRDAVARCAGPAVPIHGDAHLGNLLMTPAGPLWGDWETACLGAPEADIATLPEAAWPSFPAANPRLIALHAALKSVCVAAWCAADPQPGAAVAEAAAYHLAKVRAAAT